MLQAQDPGIWKVRLESQDVANVRSAPGVDCLVLVADDADVAAWLRQQTHDLVLRPIRVLVLVDHHVVVSAI